MSRFRQWFHEWRAGVQITQRELITHVHQLRDDWARLVDDPVPPTAIERTATGYRMRTGRTVVTTCMHPGAYTQSHTTSASTRYERRITGPGKGMIRRVQTPERTWLTRRCPDCPTVALVIGGMEVQLPPYLAMDLVSEMEGESG